MTHERVLGGGGHDFISFFFSITLLTGVLYVSGFPAVQRVGQRAIKLTLLTAHYFIARLIKIMLSKIDKIRY